MTLSATYDDTLSRVRLSATGLAEIVTTEPWVVSSATVTADAATTTTMQPGPPQVAAGDLLLAVGGIDTDGSQGGAGFTAEAGWELVSAETSTANALHGKVWQKLADAGDVADGTGVPYQWGFESNSSGAVVILAVRDHAEDPLVVAPTWNTRDTPEPAEAGADAQDAPSVTPGAGALVVHMWGGQSEAGGPYPYTLPSGVTEVDQQYVDTWMQLAVGWQVQTTSDATGPATATTADRTFAYTAMSLAVGPAQIASGDTATVERTVDGVRWSTVRGGDAVPINASGGARIDDYEFTPNVANTYRVTAGATTQSATITPPMSQVWIKNVARPFLNRAVTVVNWGPVGRPSRGGTFAVVGRTMPVAVTDVRGSRTYELELMFPDPDGAEDFDTVLAAGDPVLVHVPGGDDCLLPRSMYAVVGDYEIDRKMPRSPRRYFTLPLTEVAAPAPEIVGATVTWQSIVNAFATWSDLLDTEATWHDVAERIGEADEVIVP